MQSDMPVKMHTVRTYCKTCDKMVVFRVEERPRECYPFPFIYFHGDPTHALTSYIDARYKVRGCEVIHEFSGARDSRPAGTA